mmetsp:Transcript_22139/g.43902  ORF Transcript_22139/g.43902 Transcript_22139/m.43902 type:complete len:182 (-) Transcript_22139:173-718(-)
MSRREDKPPGKKTGPWTQKQKNTLEEGHYTFNGKKLPQQRQRGRQQASVLFPLERGRRKDAQRIFKVEACFSSKRLLSSLSNSFCLSFFFLSFLFSPSSSPETPWLQQLYSFALYPRDEDSRAAQNKIPRLIPHQTQTHRGTFGLREKGKDTTNTTPPSKYWVLQRRPLPLPLPPCPSYQV